MSPCPACTAAETNANTGRFIASCSECRARAIAGGPTYFASVQAKAMTVRYRDLLQLAFGEDWEAGNERVRHWYMHNRKLRQPGRK